MERERETERATHEGRFCPLASFVHTISDHYTCTRIRSRSARRYARVKKRRMPQPGRGTEKSREREPSDGGEGAKERKREGDTRTRASQAWEAAARFEVSAAPRRAAPRCSAPSPDCTGPLLHRDAGALKEPGARENARIGTVRRVAPADSREYRRLPR